MAARAALRLAMFLSGAALCLVAVVAMAAGWGEDRGSLRPTTAPATPSASDELSESPEPSESEPSEPESSEESSTGTPPSPEEFLEELGEATRTGDTDFLLDRLHPAVIERYGRSRCTAQVGSIRGAEFEVIRVREPAPYRWTTDDLTTVVPETVAISVDYTAGGETTRAVVHITEVDGEFTWFTDCGAPVS